MPTTIKLRGISLHNLNDFELRCTECGDVLQLRWDHPPIPEECQACHKTSPSRARVVPALNAIRHAKGIAWGTLQLTFTHIDLTNES